MDEDSFRADYRPMSNKELAELVAEGEDGYLPEAWRALQAEIASRGGKPDGSEPVEGKEAVADGLGDEDL